MKRGYPIREDVNNEVDSEEVVNDDKLKKK